MLLIILPSPTHLRQASCWSASTAPAPGAARARRIRLHDGEVDVHIQLRVETSVWPFHSAVLRVPHGNRGAGDAECMSRRRASNAVAHFWPLSFSCPPCLADTRLEYSRRRLENQASSTIFGRLIGGVAPVHSPITLMEDCVLVNISLALDPSCAHRGNDASQRLSARTLRQQYQLPQILGRHRGASADRHGNAGKACSAPRRWHNRQIHHLLRLSCGRHARPTAPRQR